MIEGTSQTVSVSDLERSLAELKQGGASGEAGLFGLDSVTWKVNRESALFLAAGRAALLQLAHPWVAAAIAEHSRTLDDPIGRFHQTFRVTFTMVFGTVEQASAAARHLHRRHQGIRGTLPKAIGRFSKGTSYEANDLSALTWVYATLVDSALLAYELLLPPLTDAEREEYYRESLRTAALFGIPHQALPTDWNGFRLFMDSFLRSDALGVSETARLMAQRLQAGSGLRIGPPFWYWALTSQLLPVRFREEFRLVYGSREQHAATRALRWLGRIYPRLPRAIRFVGPYNEARARLYGRLHPTLAVRLSNKLWIGQSSLFELPDQSNAHE